MIKTQVKTVLLLSVIFILGMFGCSTSSVTLGNTNGNIANYAYRIEVGGDIVFANSRDHLRIYRSKNDGSDLRKLSERSGMYLNIADDWIYFMSMKDDFAIVRLKSDGSSEQIISENSVFPYGGMILVSDWIYYVNHDDKDRIYRLSLDGSVNSRWIDGAAMRLNASVQGIVYVGFNEAGNTLMLANLDDAKIKTLAQDVGELTLVVNDWVYFNKATDQDKLYRVKLDGSDEQKVNDLRVYSLNVNQDRLYYSDLNNNYRLSSSKLDGTDIKVISEDKVSDILFIHGWMYYLNHTDGGREYRLKGNQSEKIIAVSKVTPLSADEPEFEGVGNTSGNLVSGGHFAQVQDALVFSGLSMEMPGMYRMENNSLESNVELISPDQGRSLNVWKEWLYYINESDNSSIYRMRSDGSETQLVLDQSVGNLMIKGNWMYFISHFDNQRIYRAKVDGSQLSAISQSQGLFSFGLDGDWLVFASGQGQTMVKVKLDGSEEQIVTSIPSTYLLVYQGWIYYGDDNSRVALSKVRLDGTDNQKLITSMASHVHVYQDYIYYYDGRLGVVLRMDMDGSNVISITGFGDYGWIHIFNDRLYMFDNSAFQWLSMELDGTVVKKLVP